MISKDEIRRLEFDNIDDFYNYVNESFVNGNFQQGKDFILRMSNTQFLEFNEYMKELGYSDKVDFIKIRLGD